jgi:hypothetical protein
MRIVLLIVGLILLISAIVILFTETKRETLGFAIGMATLAGFCFRVVTEEDI